jgi:hypothetical protein
VPPRSPAAKDAPLKLSLSGIRGFQRAYAPEERPNRNTEENHVLRSILGATALTAIAVPAMAAHLSYSEVAFSALNGQPIDASADLTYDANEQRLDVSIRGSGFTPSIFHLAHIHGFPEGPASRSPIPANGFDPNDGSGFDPAVATSNDGDGFTELAEGVPFYGPILLSFADEGELGILADADGKIDFAQSYDLSENVGGDMRAAIVNGDFGINDREIVIHGIETTAGRIDQIGEGLGGGVDPSITVDPYYNVAIPAAVGEVAPAPVPLPAGALLLLGGLGTLGAMRARSRRKA